MERDSNNPKSNPFLTLILQWMVPYRIDCYFKCIMKNNIDHIRGKTIYFNSLSLIWWYNTNDDLADLLEDVVLHNRKCSVWIYPHLIATAHMKVLSKIQNSAFRKQIYQRWGVVPRKSKKSPVDRSQPLWAIFLEISGNEKYDKR